MPWINGRFYANPTYGLAVERARENEHSSKAIESAGEGGDSAEGHWVTIGGRHVLIQEERKREKSKQFTGEATYYDLPGRKTASGQKFDPNKMAAAMTAEKVRLGQSVTVTYTSEDKDGKSVTRSISVIVNDRGPFARGDDGKASTPLHPASGRVIDLTPAAFRELVGTTKPGHVTVTVTVPND